MKLQEPKYQFVAGGVQNRASGELIPPDEPVMVFRARDTHARQMIAHYLTLLRDPQHIHAVGERLADFQVFAAEHPDRMKEPDTDWPFGLKS